MTDREVIIEWLECCSTGGCSEKCPYFEADECYELLAKDALDLLKEQERRIVELEQLISYERNVKALGCKQKA